MTLWRSSAIGALALSLAACSTASQFDVQTDADPAADFSRYHTYSWVYSDPPSGMDPIKFERIRDSIDRQLAAQGFSQGDPGDFAVAFTVGARDKVRVDDFGPYAAFYPGMAFG